MIKISIVYELFSFSVLKIPRKVFIGEDAKIKAEEFAKMNFDSRKSTEIVTIDYLHAEDFVFTNGDFSSKRSKQ